MKKFSLFFFIAISSFVFAQEGIKFENTSFASILAKAEKENKLVFLDAYTTWCGPCKMLEKNVFPKKEIGDFYNATFVNARIDMEKGEGLEIAKKYKIYSYPTLLFLDGKGNIVQRVAGYYNPDDFLKIGKNAGNQENSLEKLTARFNAGEKDPEFLLDLIKLTFNTDFSFSQKVSEKFFKNKTTEFTKEDVGMLLFFTKSMKDENYQTFLSKKSEITKHLPEAFYQQFNQQIKFSAAREIAINKETGEINETLFLSEAKKYVTESEAKTELLRLKLQTALNKKDFISFEKLAQEYYTTPNNFDPNELNSAAWNFFLHVENKAALKKAIEWSQFSVAKQENYAFTDTLANLYHKIGDKKKALVWAEKSVALAKISGDDSTETQKLIDQIKK